MRSTLRLHLAREVADWHHQGLIDAALAEQLARRYGRRGDFGAALLKWLGLLAVLLLGLSVLALVATVTESLLVGALLSGAASVAMWWWGVRFATDPAQRHPVSGAALVSAGLAGGFGALVLLALAVDPEAGRRTVCVLMLLAAAAALLTAYRYRLRWPLLVGLLFAFHGLGAWHSYGGWGHYFADIQEPRLMAPIALAVALLGLYHQHVIEPRRLPRCTGFGHLYLVLGLLYFNVSLWFLSLERAALAWVLVFTLAAIAQIVAGARLHDARLTGFGVVFLSIDLYTRFWEHFWDRLSLGTFMLAGGLAAVLAGFLIERRGAGT